GYGNEVLGNGSELTVQHIFGYNNTAMTEADNAKQYADGGFNTLISDGDAAYQVASGEDNVLVANGKDNYQVAGEGNDTIVTGGGYVSAGAGDDTVHILAGAGETKVDLGAGDDVVNLEMTNENANIEINGGEGNDRINIKDSTVTDTNWNVNFEVADDNTAFTLQVGENTYVVTNDVEALNIVNAEGEVVLNIENVNEWKQQQLEAQEAQVAA
ncbi:MAG: hypothetical protein AB7V50_05645, partial [Vampirovibrionia bacterium]